MRWDKQIPALRETLQLCFPNASAERVSLFADEIYNGASAASSLQWIERNDNQPLDDRTILKKAALDTRKAAAQVRKLGWHGALAMNEMARKVHQMQYRYNGSSPALSAQDAIDTVALFLDGLANDFQRCAREIALDAGPIMSEFGDDRPAGRKRGTPHRTEAYYAALEAYSAFEALGEKKPSVTTDRITGVAGGAFLRLVKMVFKDLEISASAETCARKVCKEKKP